MTPAGLADADERVGARRRATAVGECYRPRPGEGHAVRGERERDPAVLRHLVGAGADPHRGVRREPVGAPSIVVPDGVGCHVLRVDPLHVGRRIRHCVPVRVPLARTSPVLVVALEVIGGNGSPIRSKTRRTECAGSAIDHSLERTVSRRFETGRERFGGERSGVAVASAGRRGNPTARGRASARATGRRGTARSHGPTDVGRAGRRGWSARVGRSAGRVGHFRWGVVPWASLRSARTKALQRLQ